MEALSCGLPIVATRVGGIPDIIEEGTSGFLVDRGDSDGLASALITLLRDPSQCLRMGRAAKEFADTHLDISRTADRLVELYRDTIAARSAAHGAEAGQANGVPAIPRITTQASGNRGAL
jgi:glycosyltransferase involved in cell wall biosynthesis